MSWSLNSAGRMGAALRQSPALHTSDASLFEHSGIQDWLSFLGTGIRADLTLIAGVAVGTERHALTSMVRPLGKNRCRRDIPTPLCSPIAR